MMAGTATKSRHRSRRRISALNFLSNISLDGTHRDTNYSIFHQKGFGNLRYKHRDNCNDVYATQTIDPYDECHVISPDTGTAEATSSQASLFKTKNSSKPQLRRVRSKSFYDNPSLPVQLDSSHSSDNLNLKSPVSKNDENTPLSTNKRTQSFSGDKQRSKRKLFHTLSISEDSDQTITVESKDVVESLSNRSRHMSSSASSSSIDSINQKQKEVCYIKRPRDRVIKNERVVFLSEKKAPIFMFSLLPYRKGNIAKQVKSDVPNRRVRHTSTSYLTTSVEGLLTLGIVAVQVVEDGQDVSYSQFLVPCKNQNTKSLPNYENSLHPPPSDTGHISPGLLGVGTSPAFRSFSFEPSMMQKLSPNPEKGEKEAWQDGMYDPYMLDNPELGSGKHRTLMTFPSYMTSVIDYVKPSDLKKDLNEQFKEKFPAIQLTLSKFRSLKSVLKKIGHNKCGIDLWTIAQSYVYFEKIVLQGLINKANRRLVASVCLMLSAKLNDIKGQELSKLIEELEDFFKLHRKDMIAFEFAVLVAMEFTLHIPDSDVYPHFKRLLYNS